MQTVENAVRAFREAAIEKGDFADPKQRDHELWTSMTAAVRFLRAQGANGENAFRELLTDPSQHVRSWAATELLSRGDSAAREVLEELASEDGFVGLGVRHVLREHDAGRLRSPFTSVR